jgi:hypothetical protein
MTTRAQWAESFLAYADWEVSQEKVIALVAQASKEGSEANWNPLDTTEPAPNATDYNAVGVKNYPSQAEGLAATLATFKNGFYPQLVAILSDPAGGSATSYADNVELNTWGTGNILAFVESIKSGDPNGYMDHEVTGVGGISPFPPGPAPAPRLGVPPAVFRRSTLDD